MPESVARESNDSESFGSESVEHGPVYLTTPLYYVNAEPHLGHTYTTVVVDTLARYHRSRGREVFFLTGTDEHGDKIAQAADAAAQDENPGSPAGSPESSGDPKAYADKISALFRSTWDTCGISYDHFIRTTDDYHRKFVGEVLQKVYDSGDIYFGEYGGLYCVGCERFYTEKELDDGKCPDHETEPEHISEKNYFFRMGKYQQQLLDHIEANPEWISPVGYRNEVLGLLREPLEDLCISRPKTRLTWGIDLPFDDNYVCYVWFDALLNYLSGIHHSAPDRAEDLWKSSRHFIAKDIVKPHAVFWPTMLMSAGFAPSHRLHVHGYWNMGDSKMSKSLGNVIRPLDMRERFGMDSFRYFLLREMAFGTDSSFTEDAFVTRYNADLCNGLGNLLNRVLGMQGKYFAGAVQDPASDPPAEDRELHAAFAKAEEGMIRHLEGVSFHQALEEIWVAVGACDKYVADTAPYKLAKDEASLPRVGEILHLLCDALRMLARLIAPVLPETSARIGGLLGVEIESLAAPVSGWGTVFETGQIMTKPEQPLFDRLVKTDEGEILKQGEARQREQDAKAGKTGGTGKTGDTDKTGGTGKKGESGR